MGERLAWGDPPVSIALRRNARARRITLRVSAADGRVTMTLPPGVRRTEATAFLAAQNGWLRGVLSARPVPIRVEAGAAIPVEGRACRVAFRQAGPVRVDDDRLLLPARRPGPRLRAHLRAMAAIRLSAEADRLTPILGLSPARLVLRDPRSRWGSCSSDGRVMLSWRLIMAPPAVFDYVVAHELAHLVHLDHSPRFWGLVDRLCPDRRVAQDWLRRQGAGLHGYDFS